MLASGALTSGAPTLGAGLVSTLGAAPKVVLPSGAASTIGAASTPDTLATSSASVTSDLLSDRDDWPRWFVDGVDYLQDVLTTETWVALLESFVRLERSLGFTGMVSKHHSAVTCSKLTNIKIGKD